jgi:hypothetical protein
MLLPLVPIKVKLTEAQAAFAKEALVAAESMGDCEIHGFSVVFPDYEGAEGFQNRVMALPTTTTRAYVSMDAIVRKIDAAIAAKESN